MFRTTVRRTTRIITNLSTKNVKPRVTRRFASNEHGEHAKPSSDLPWAIPSLLVTVPVVIPPPTIPKKICQLEIDWYSVVGYGLLLPRWSRTIV